MKTLNRVVVDHNDFLHILFPSKGSDLIQSLRLPYRQEKCGQLPEFIVTPQENLTL